MRIVRATATFGCLENATLTLQPGMNLLEMPNEAGKSTWCAFLQAMLYGLESRKGGSLSERNRRVPWSGSVMAGEMELIWQDSSITLRRFPKGSDPFGGFEAVYTGTGEPVPGLAADNAGEVLLGVTKEVFRRACFIPQGGLWVDKSGDLERRVAALAAAGEEDVSFSDAAGRLRSWRNARQSNRATGTLPKLRERLAAAQAQRQRLLEARSRGEEARLALEELERERRAVEADLERHAQLERAGQAADRRARYDAAKARLAETQAQLDAAQAAADRARAQLPPQPGQSFALWLPLIAGLAALTLLVPIGVMTRLTGAVIAGVFAALAGAAVSLLLARRRERRRQLYARDLACWERARAQLEDARRQHVAAQAAWDALSAQGEPPAPPPASDLPRQDLAEDRSRLAQLKDAIARRADQRARAQGEEEALGGLAPIEEALASLTEEIARQEGELQALELALDALTAANAQLQARFSPALNQRAGQLLSRLTGGRYSALTFTREFQALARSDGPPRGAQLLSQGTADQAYLALRLAICLLALPQEDTAPLVLDDALVTFDDARLKLALELLGELAQDRQILLFTCQSRERALLG